MQVRKPKGPGHFSTRPFWFLPWPFWFLGEIPLTFYRQTAENLDTNPIKLRGPFGAIYLWYWVDIGVILGWYWGVIGGTAGFYTQILLFFCLKSVVFLVCLLGFSLVYALYPIK